MESDLFGWALLFSCLFTCSFKGFLMCIFKIIYSKLWLLWLGHTCIWFADTFLLLRPTCVSQSLGVAVFLLGFHQVELPNLSLLFGCCSAACGFYIMLLTWRSCALYAWGFLLRKWLFFTVIWVEFNSSLILLFQTGKHRQCLQVADCIDLVCTDLWKEYLWVNISSWKLRH